MPSKMSTVFSAALVAATFASAATIAPEMPSLSGGCYQISTPAELFGFAAIVNGDESTAGNKTACGKLLKDINLNEDVPDIVAIESLVIWEPIKSFSGTFDGNGHVISRLLSMEDVGLFDTLDASDGRTVVVKNLGIEESVFMSSSRTAGFLAKTVVGDGSGSVRVTNFYTHAYAMIDNYSFSLGAIVGLVKNGGRLALKNCYSMAEIQNNSANAIGRLVGENNGEVEVERCYRLKLSENDRDYYAANPYYGKMVDTVSFRNGAVAFSLREGTDGSIWGQKVGTDEYPIFSGKLVNSVAARYNITFHTFNGDTAEYLDSYIAGFITKLPANVVRRGYAFGGWYRDAEFSGNRDTVISDTVTGNLEYWAKMYRRYKITYHPNGGKIERTSSYTCMEDEAIVGDTVECYLAGIGQGIKLKILRDSSIFVGWYDNEELTGNPVDSITPDETGDKHLYAKWLQLKRPSIDLADSCYEISDVAELYGFSALVDGSFVTGERDDDKRLVNACGKLTKDIVVNENVLKRDGSLDSSRINNFIRWKMILFYNGSFDGQGHTISGLYMEDCQGMFYTHQSSKYYVTRVAIRNLKVRDSFLSSDYSAGGIISGYDESRARIEIENTHFDGTIVIPSDYLNTYIGGLVGEVHYPLIIKNSSHRGLIRIGEVTGAVGGLVGLSDYYTFLIQNSNEGRIVSEAEFAGTYHGGHVGGLVGEVSKHFFIVNNYNAADIDCRVCTVNGLIGGYYIQPRQINALAPYWPLQSFVLNNHSNGSIVYGKLPELDESVVTFANNFYLEGTLSLDSIGTPAKASAFEDGTVTRALHDYVQKDADGNELAGGAYGANWIQGDEYPVLNGSETRDLAWLYVSDYSELLGYVLFYTPGQELPLPTPSLSGYTFLGWELEDDMVTSIPSTASGILTITAEWEAIPSSSSVASSSSEPPASSSSAKSSSSSVKSSSSSAKSSSSVKSSSSSAKSSSSSAKSSSSKAKSSSSKGKDALPVMGEVPQFSLTVVGRSVQVAGARVGAAYAVLDMQGRVLESGRVNAANFSLLMNRAATYLVRVGSQTQAVNIR